jgi:hypothetical protein
MENFGNGPRIFIHDHVSAEPMHFHHPIRPAHLWHGGSMPHAARPVCIGTKKIEFDRLFTSPFEFECILDALRSNPIRVRNHNFGNVRIRLSSQGAMIDIDQNASNSITHCRDIPRNTRTESDRIRYPT